VAFWFTRTTDPGRATAQLGPLEWRALETLWTRAGAAVSVRDLTADFPDIAYTTLMTTLDRLYRKGVLLREKQGRAFLYLPRFTRAEFESARAADALRTAIQGVGSLTPIASCLIDAVGDRDRELLAELEALVAARRADQKGKRA
jgi:predicted transcriptional regulator